MKKTTIIMMGVAIIVVLGTELGMVVTSPLKNSKGCLCAAFVQFKR